MDVESMFNISVDLYQTVSKKYPEYDISEFVLRIMIKASENIFSSNISHTKGSYYNMKKELNVIHLYKSFNSLSTNHKRLTAFNTFRDISGDYKRNIHCCELLGRYKNINKWIKAIKYHDKKRYYKYIKPIIRYINNPKLGAYSIKPFDINNCLDIFETASYNNDELKTLKEALSNYTQSFRVITGTNIAMIHINQYIDFIPLRNAINIIKKSEPPNIIYPNEFYEGDNIINDKSYKAYFFRYFERFRVMYNVAEILFHGRTLYIRDIYKPFLTTPDIIKFNRGINKKLDLYKGMPFLNISESSSKNVNDDVDAFFDLLRNMFINEEDAVYIIKYIAWIIQHPGRQSNVVPVLHTSKNTSHIIKHISKIFQNYAYTTSKSIYDKMKCNNSLHELVCKMLVIIDDDLPLYEDMSNFSTKYQTSNKNYKPNKEFECFANRCCHLINIKVKGSETLQLININNYIVLSNDINSYVKKSKCVKYFIPRLCLSNICKDIKYPSIKTNFYEFYRELTLRFVRMPLDNFDIDKVPEFEYKRNIYRMSFHKMNPIRVLIGVLMNLNVLYDKFPIRLIRRIIYEITFIQSYKLFSDVLLCDMKELTFEGEQAFSYLFTKLRDIDCGKIMSKLNIYFEPAGYSSFNKFLRTYENYGINSNEDLDFLRSDKSEKFIKFNANIQQKLEYLKINIFKCIQPKPNLTENASVSCSMESKDSSAQSTSSEHDKSDILDGLRESKEINGPNVSNISIEVQNDSIVIHLNSKKNIK